MFLLFERHESRATGQIEDDQNKHNIPMYKFNLLKMHVYLLFFIRINSDVRDVTIIN